MSEVTQPDFLLITLVDEYHISYIKLEPKRELKGINFNPTPAHLHH